MDHRLALWLVAIGETVVDVAPTATARVRQLSRAVGDARTTASTLLPRQASQRCTAMPQVRPETHADSLALLDEQRKNLSSTGLD